MTDENHPPGGEQPVCEREKCRRPLPPSRGTKPRRFCSRSCVQRAYEERRQEELISAAVASALLRARKSREAAEAEEAKSREAEAKSRDLSPEPVATSREEARPPVPAPAPRPPEEERYTPIIGGISMPWPGR